MPFSFMHHLFFEIQESGDSNEEEESDVEIAAPRRDEGKQAKKNEVCLFMHAVCSLV